MQIKHFIFDSEHDQSAIASISDFLEYLGSAGFSIVHYGRPPSFSKYSPNLELIVQRPGRITEDEQETIDEWMRLPRREKLFARKVS